MRDNGVVVRIEHRCGEDPPPAADVDAQHLGAAALDGRPALIIDDPGAAHLIESLDGHHVGDFNADKSHSTLHR